MKIRNGDRVRFRDVGNVRHGSHGIVEAEGTVNGEPIDGRSSVTAENRRLWPVYAERDHGREATTIYVDERNILGKVTA